MIKKFNKKLVYLLVLVLLFTSQSVVSIKTAAAADEYDTLRAKWMIYLTGGTGYDISDPDISSQIAALTADAQTYWNSLDKSVGRTILWTDLTPLSNNRILSNNFKRLQLLATAYNTSGSSLYNNASLASDIVNATDWLCVNYYNAGRSINGAWPDLEFPIPKELDNIMVLLYDKFTPTRITNYINAIDHFVPDPTQRLEYSLVETGSNRLDKGLAVALRGIIGKSSSKIQQGRDAISATLTYVTSGDGVYTDGSFVFHGTQAYSGGYGAELLGRWAEFSYLLAGSSWAITDPNFNNVYDWVSNVFWPVMYKGAIMDMTSGRGVTRFNASDHSRGRNIIAQLPLLALGAPSSKAAEFNGMVKYTVQSDTTFSPNYYNSDGLSDGVSLNQVNLFKQVMNNSSITPAPELIGNYNFNNMSRTAHFGPGYALGISMFSNRISAFETGDNGPENKKGFYTGAGMTYLYNNDLTQFSGNYWPTVNMTRLPGTTTDGYIPAPTYSSFLNTNNDVGGATLGGLYGVTGMKYSMKNLTGSNLAGQKSWFIFDDEIVALGAGITSTDNRNVETIVENRKLNASGNNALTVNGTVKSSNLGWSETMTGVNWAHLAGNVANSDIGYYFPSRTTVQGLREARTGTWTTINTTFPNDTPYTNNYLSLALGHGTNPSNASYSYVLLPNKTAAQVSSYASNPDITVVENSTEAQSVKENTLNIVAAKFWGAATKTTDIITANKYAAVITKETAGSPSTLDVAVSDLTMANTGTIDVEINKSASAIVSNDPQITVTQLSPTIKLTVNVNGAKGKSFNAKFNLGTGTGFSGNYKLINPNSGKALNVTGTGTANGTNVDIGTDIGSPAQKWQIVQVSSGIYKLINPNSGKALDVTGNGTANGTNVEIWTDIGSTAQKWQIVQVSSGIYKLINPNSGKALDVTGNGTANGTNVEIWTDNGTPAQQWQLISVP